MLRAGPTVHRGDEIVEAKVGELVGLEQPRGTDICLVLKWGQGRDGGAGGTALPIHTSPKQPWPSLTSSRSDSRGISQASLARP